MMNPRHPEYSTWAANEIKYLRKKLAEKDQTLDLLAELFVKINSMLPAKIK